MNPFFFGHSAHPLYGVYHPPQVAKQAPSHAVLLCYPFGQEYMRAHRAYRQLASQLAKKGYHVMRFDYRGTGDSSGDLSDVVFSDWLDDVGVATEELKDMTSASEMSVVGLRLGALVAATAAEKIPDLSGLVLWDPIISGGAYQQELTDEMPEQGGSLSNFIDENGDIYFNGFSLRKAFLQDATGYDLLTQCEKKPKLAQRALQIVSHETAGFTHLANQYGFNEGFQYAYTPAPSDWNFVDNWGGILLPQPVIQGIVDWFE